METNPAMQEEKHQVESQLLPSKVAGFCSFRYGVAVLLHFVNIGIVAQPVCLGLTMVAMVNRTDGSAAPNASAVWKLDDVKNPVYNWSPGIQGIILSSITYGLLIAQIPVGYLSGICPVKKMITSALVLSSMFVLLTPQAAQFGPALLIVNQVLLGITQATVMTGQHVIWVKWAPPLERGRLISVSFSGVLLAPFIVMLVSGYICDLLGWPMVFYIIGAYGCAMSLLWFTLFYDDPKDHPCISIREQEYIASSLAQQVSSSRHPLPIKAMLKSLPLWAIAFNNFAFSWSASFFVTYTPTYIHSVLHLNVRENGLLSGLPHLFAWISGILAGEMSDFLLSRKIFSLITIRKLFTTVGILFPSIFALSLLSPSLDFYGTIILLILVSSSLNCSTAGGLINALDLAPRYYGFLKAFIAVIGMSGSLTSTTVAGLILNQGGESSWSLLFFLLAGISVSSCIFYLIFAKAEIQDWARDGECTKL